MESLVMTEPIPDGFYEEYYDDFKHVPQMYPLLTEVSYTEGGLGYTVFYYLTQIVRNGVFDDLTMIPMNGVAPDSKTIGNRSYPFTAEVYAIIRSDLDKSSMTYKIYELMQTEAGKRIIQESGYVPN
jgi:phosphate transport system substrate-binding protein